MLREPTILVRCEGCAKQYTLQASRLPAGGGRIACPSCGRIIFVRPRPQASAGLQRSIEPLPVAPPGRANTTRCLQITYLRAEDYVREYAENLSRGGLFIAGVRGLRPRDRVQVQIELCGFGIVTVETEVAHLVDEETAVGLGRSAGAGFAIKRAPVDFQDTLSAFLVRLGARREARVLVGDAVTENLVRAGGYVTETAPEPTEIINALGTAPIFVALVVQPAQASAYRQALEPANLDGLILEIPQDGGIHRLLEQIDARILALPELAVTEAFTEPEVDDLLSLLSEVADTAADMAHGGDLAEVDELLRGFVESTRAFVSRSDFKLEGPTIRAGSSQGGGLTRSESQDTLREMLVHHQTALSADPVDKAALRPRNAASPSLQALLHTSLAALSETSVRHAEQDRREINDLLVSFLKDTITDQS